MRKEVQSPGSHQQVWGGNSEECGEEGRGRASLPTTTAGRQLHLPGRCVCLIGRRVATDCLLPAQSLAALILSPVKFFVFVFRVFFSVF